MVLAIELTNGLLGERFEIEIEVGVVSSSRRTGIRSEALSKGVSGLFEEIGDQYRQSDVWDLLSKIYEDTNELEKALSSTTKAHRLFQSSSKRTW